MLACRENKEDFEGFLGEEFDAYTNSMAQMGTWGDELTLVSITIIQSRHGILNVVSEISRDARPLFGNKV